MKKLLLISSFIFLIAQESVGEMTFGEKILEAAKKYLNVPFGWGGRSKRKLDCMGLIFLAYKDVTGKDWRKLSVFPSQLVKSEKLGKPVKGLDGVLKNDLDSMKLKKGDILYFLVKDMIYRNDPPLVEINDTFYYVWHMGIFAGFDSTGVPLCLHAKPGYKVIIEPLKNIYFEALFVTRLDSVIDSLDSK